MATRRRAEAVRNDELFLDAGLELLRERGPDRMAALELARSAGLTTGAVYARYENPAEIMVGLWQQRIATPMRMFLENSLSALIDGSEEANAAVMRALTNPSGPLRPGASILLASPRIPQLAEVVGPDLRRWSDEFGLDTSDTADRAHRTAVVSATLGSLVFATADMLSLEDWNFLRQWANRALNHSAVGRFPLPEPLPLPEVRVETGDPARDALVNGAARVIANGGLELATTQRIARAADLTTSELFALYRTRSELFADVADRLLSHLFGQFRTVAPPVHDHDRSSTWQQRFLTERLGEFRWLLASENAQPRLLRLEFHLAALHDDDIGDALRRVDRTVNENIATTVATDFGLDRGVLLRGLRMLRSTGLGSILLQELLGDLGQLDLRYAYEPLVSILEDSAS